MVDTRDLHCTREPCFPIHPLLLLKLPPRQCRRFKHRDAALAELDRLRATPGAEIVGGISPVPPRFAALQEDFGFPLSAGPPRMTP